MCYSCVHVLHSTFRLFREMERERRNIRQKCYGFVVLLILPCNNMSNILDVQWMDIS